MKSTKAIVRIIAVLATLAMLMSFGGCIKAYNNDPVVVKTGSVKQGLQRYLSVFQNSSYYQYYQQGYISGDTYSDYVLNELISYGVQLDQVKKQGITLTEEEEAKVQADVDDQIKSYLEENYKDKIDQTLTDATEIYNAEMDKFVESLKAGGTNFKAYRKELEENIRNSALVNKLRDSVVGDITVNNDDVKKYYEDNLKTDTTISSFNTAFGNFITGSSTSIPLYMPVVTAQAEETTEDAAEDSGETAETAEPNPYDELFSVLHTLVKFAAEPGDDVTDLAAYAAEDESVSRNMEFIEQKMSTFNAEEFMQNICFNSDVCEDPGMQKEAYQFFGYLMSESLISSYYDGFGEAAMKLNYLDWEPKAEEETEESSDASTEEKAEKDRNITRLALADGTEVMRVFTDAGVHYIMINPNNWNCMYGEDGKLLVPLYEGDEPVKDGDFYKTINDGVIPAEVFDAMQQAFSHVGDKEAEGFVESTCKSLYDFFNDGALNLAQNNKYTEVFNEWKDATKIKVKKNIIKAFTQGN